MALAGSKRKATGWMANVPANGVHAKAVKAARSGVKSPLDNPALSHSEWLDLVLSREVLESPPPLQTPVAGLLSERNRGVRGPFVTRLRTVQGNLPVACAMQDRDVLLFNPLLVPHGTASFEVSLCKLCMRQHVPAETFCRPRHLGFAFQTGLRHLKGGKGKGGGKGNKSGGLGDHDLSCHDWVASHRAEGRKLVIVREERAADGSRLIADVTTKEFDPTHYVTVAEVLNSWYVITEATTVVVVDSGRPRWAMIYQPAVIDPAMGAQLGTHLRDMLHSPPSRNLQRHHSFEKQAVKNQNMFMMGLCNNATNRQYRFAGRDWSCYAGCEEAKEYLLPCRDLGSAVAEVVQSALPQTFDSLQSQTRKQMWDLPDVQKFVRSFGGKKQLPLDRQGIFATCAPTDTYWTPFHLDKDDCFLVACTGLKVPSVHPGTAPPPNAHSLRATANTVVLSAATAATLSCA